jgi:hypothetical protein
MIDAGLPSCASRDLNGRKRTKAFAGDPYRAEVAAAAGRRDAAAPKRSRPLREHAAAGGGITSHVLKRLAVYIEKNVKLQARSRPR